MAAAPDDFDMGEAPEMLDGHDLPRAGTPTAAPTAAASGWRRAAGHAPRKKAAERHCGLPPRHEDDSGPPCSERSELSRSERSSYLANSDQL